MENVIVAIYCTVYNHAKYLRQCLDGFLMQKTDFKFVVVVHDDASTDGSIGIINEYVEKYPAIILPIYEEINQYSDTRVARDKLYNATIAYGIKYIANCEGDDYWTDEYKLQKQISFLESHPDFVMCTTRLKVFNEKEQTYNSDFLPLRITGDGKVYDLEDCLSGRFYFHLQTLVYRADASGYSAYRKCRSGFDRVLAFYLLSDGSKGMCIPDVTACYRRNENSVWAYKQSIERFEIVVKATMAVYENTPDYNAARFIYSNLSRGISRKWILHNKRNFCSMLFSIQRHLGFRPCLKLIWNNILLGKYFEI